LPISCWLRGVAITQGEKYPAAYATLSGRKFGKYDMHFTALVGDQQGKKINVELFGGSPGGRGNYAETRAFKEQFHKDDPTFLALEYKDCLTDAALLKKLLPFIGDRPVIRAHASRLAVPSTQLSFVNDTLKAAKELCEKMPDKKMPTARWLTRSDEHKNRVVYDWEPASWSRLCTRIQSIGFNVVRELLEKERATPQIGPVARMMAADAMQQEASSSRNN